MLCDNARSILQSSTIHHRSLCSYLSGRPVHKKRSTGHIMGIKEKIEGFLEKLPEMTEEEANYIADVIKWDDETKMAFMLAKSLFESQEGELDEDSNFVLEDEDRDLFLEALKNPPEPNEKMKKAFEEYNNNRF